MTKLLDMAIKAASQLPPEKQDELARTILEIVGDGEIYVLSPEEREAIAEGIAQAERGEFATDEEVAELFAKYRI